MLLTMYFFQKLSFEIKVQIFVLLTPITKIFFYFEGADVFAAARWYLVGGERAVVVGFWSDGSAVFELPDLWIELLVFRSFVALDKVHASQAAIMEQTSCEMKLTGT